MNLPTQKKPIKAFKKMLRNDIVYSFTVTPNDKHQHFEEGINRMHKIHQSYKKIFQILDHSADYLLQPEFSTPDPYKCIGHPNTGPRFHFHGLIRFRNVGQYYVNGFHDLLKYTTWEIDTIDNKELWTDYIRKDCEVMKPLIKQYGYKYWSRTGFFIK